MTNMRYVMMMTMMGWTGGSRACVVTAQKRRPGGQTAHIVDHQQHRHRHQHHRRHHHQPYQPNPHSQNCHLSLQ